MPYGYNARLLKRLKNKNLHAALADMYAELVSSKSSSPAKDRVSTVPSWLQSSFDYRPET